jgi:hypothetical protein
VSPSPPFSHTQSIRSIRSIRFFIINPFLARCTASCAAEGLEPYGRCGFFVIVGTAITGYESVEINGESGGRDKECQNSNGGDWYKHLACVGLMGAGRCEVMMVVDKGASDGVSSFCLDGNSSHVSC